MKNLKQKKISGTQQSIKWDARSAASYAMQEEQALGKDEQIRKKYASISSLNRADKVEALKNVDLNPYLLNSSYDALSNSMHRWTVVAKDASSGKFSTKEMQNVASNYYDKMIAPLYGSDPWQMHIAPMDKKLWLHEAFNKAKDYKIEDAYENNLIHAFKHGWNEGIPQLARAGEAIYNAIGNLVSAPKQHTDEEYSPWFHQAQQLHKSVFEPLDKRDPVHVGSVAQQSDHQFWAEALPNHDGWLNTATSMIAEQAAQLPMYIAMGNLSKAGEGFNLTKQLASSKLGDYVFKSLMAGTEGLAYGAATRPQEDKDQAWKDAVGFLAFHQVFTLGGKGLGRLIDVVPEDSKMGSLVRRRAENLDLASKGLRRATPEEKYEQHVQHESSVMAVSGIPGVQSKLADAIIYQRAVEERGVSKAELLKMERKNLSEDPARWAPLLASVSFIRGEVGKMGKRLTEITAGSEEAKSLESAIDKLVGDAATKMNTSSAPVIAENVAQASKDLKQPSAKLTREYYKAKVLADVAKMNPAAQKTLKPEEVEKMIDKKYAAGVAKAAKVSEETLTNKIGKAVDVAKRRKNKSGLKIRSERTVDKYGQPAVRYSVNQDYKIKILKYKQDAMESGKTLEQFFQDMGDEDFAADLSNHFFPPALQKAGIYFEHQNTKEGVQNPNFLGFMYNYIDKMPKEFGQALEERLINSMKVQKFMNGRKPTTPQLLYFARAMYNHVDNFLGSGRWPEEHNIFRSTQDTMWQSTEWQQELLVEKMKQEEKNIKDMFPDLGPKRRALGALRILQQERLREYAKGPKDMESQKRVMDKDTEISDFQTATGEYERIPF